jgi:predicted nucleic acid-binding protein
VPEELVLDASAVVEALLGTDLGVEIRQRMRGHRLHAPAHLDAEVLSALGRLHRAGEVPLATVTAALAASIAPARSRSQRSLRRWPRSPPRRFSAIH